MSEAKEPQLRHSIRKFFNNPVPPPQDLENLDYCRVKFQGLKVVLGAWQVQYILDTGLKFEAEVKSLQSKLEKSEGENQLLRDQLEFTKQYLNPEDTSFRQMIDAFRVLSDERKQKLIDLTRSLLALKGEGE